MKHLLSPLLLAVALAVAACNGLFRKVIPADNDRCHVCHINYADEKLALTHAKQGVGCEKCHGPSNAHCGSETHEIPPDIMYPHPKINPSCMTCHPKEKLGGQEMHCMVLDPNPPMKRYCTDCHGTHRLSERKVRWDKATRNLLPQR